MEYLDVLRHSGYTVLIFCDDEGYHAIIIKGCNFMLDDLFGVPYHYSAPALEQLVMDIETSPKLLYVELN